MVVRLQKSQTTDLLESNDRPTMKGRTSLMHGSSLFNAVVSGLRSKLYKKSSVLKENVK